jgi:hypothetical protein
MKSLMLPEATTPPTMPLAMMTSAENIARVRCSYTQMAPEQWPGV